MLTDTHLAQNQGDPDTAQLLPIILCGGSGTRLWPLSRRDLPKQFAPLVHGHSLLHLTLERARLLGPALWLVASEGHRFLVQEALEATGTSSGARVLLEPVGRNTAAAMAAVCLNAPAHALLLFLPADHHIPDAQLFASTVRSAAAAARAGQIVTLGVQPSSPSTAYGYIEAGAALTRARPAYHVQRFIEKPALADAQQMLLQGGYFWNAGVFLARCDVMLAALQAHASDIVHGCQAAVQSQQEDGGFVHLGADAFAQVRAQSIDYAVMEHARNVAVVPYGGAWSDVGSWSSIAQLADADALGNRIQGSGYCVQAQGTYIHAGQRPVVALGTRDVLIVDTPDALLVADAQHTQAVREVVQLLEAQGVPQAHTHRHVPRPWGSFDSVDSGPRFQVKRITVKPGGRLSLQMHHHRAEHWIVVQGTARVTCGERVFDLQANESTFIPKGERHRLENLGSEPLQMIEVQSGDYLGEDDIVRFDDQYGRA